MEGKFTVHIVPHTHWDREWYYTLEEFRYRLVKLMDSLIDIMERDVITYFVMDGQTIVLQDYLAVRPENRERLEKLTKCGRIRIGPWYTQPNVYMSDAESQVRNLIWGRRDMEKWGGGMHEVNHMPDQFGYTSQLPQMMAEFGLTHLVGARGLPKQCDTYFRWEGADGTVVHVLALPHSYINACGISPRLEQQVFDVFGEKISMPSLTDRMAGVMEEKNRSIAPHLLALNGVDHMYPNPQMLETIEKIREVYPDVDVKQSNFEDYIKDVKGSLTREPTVYKGEHRDPRENFILPASQSTRMDVKMFNRRMEDLLEQRLEPILSLMGSLGEASLPMAEYRMAWELMLQNHAHDSLCCANSEPSYREILTRFDKVSDIGREICNELDQRMIRRIKNYPVQGLLVRNPSVWERNEPVTVEITVSNNRNYAEPHLFYDGKEIPAQVLGARTDMLLRYVPFSGFVGQLQVAVFRMTLEPGAIPAGGWKLLEVKGGGLHPRAVEGLVRGQNEIENEYLKVSIEPDATLTVTDKRNGQIYSGLNRFSDTGEAGCGFIHAAPYGDNMQVSAGKNLSLTVIENDTMKGQIAVSQDFPVPAGLAATGLGRSEKMSDLHITTQVILRKGCPYVEFETEVENCAKDHRLRAVFPSDTNIGTAYAGQPFDVVERPVQPANVNVLETGDYEPFVGYHPMLDFCGIDDRTRGFAVAGDGIMEYEVLPMRNSVSITLIRATDRLHVGVLGAGSKFKIPAAQLQGSQHFRYAFVPQEKSRAALYNQVQAFRHPLALIEKDFLEAECMPDYVPAPQTLPATGGFIEVRGDVTVTCQKPAENGNGIILRFYNPADRQTSVTVQVLQPWALKAASRVRMDETGDTSIKIQDNAVYLTAEAKKIVSLRLSAKQSETYA